MVKFATFETVVDMIYKQLGKPKDSYNGLQQTGVSFLGGYIAGIGAAVASHPADVMVSKLNSDRKPGEGAGAALSRIYSNIGFKGLFNGVGIRIIMIGTLTGAQWLIYDTFKVFLGVSLPKLAVPYCIDYPNSFRQPAAIEEEEVLERDMHQSGTEMEVSLLFFLGLAPALWELSINRWSSLGHGPSVFPAFWHMEQIEIVLVSIVLARFATRQIPVAVTRRIRLRRCVVAVCSIFRRLLILSIKFIQLLA
jgi:hypothetical protein